MRKIASLLTMSMFFCSLAFGQPREVRGTVRDASGAPVPFATVTQAGTPNAVTADANGNFTIRVPENARLTISSQSFSAETVTVANAANVTLRRTQLEEVVVTALGLRRKPQEIGYGTATVRPDQITASKSFNIGQALSGKVSGLQIQNTSGAVNATPRITLRGLRSLTGVNTALIVLDGVQVPSNTINFINPNDVERIDIMKGGQASTLFGSEGVNGAIIITTKKGSGAAKPEITLQYSGNTEQVAFLPKTQSSFGSGSAYGSSPSENFHPSENQQFGPRYDGSIRPAGRALADGSTLLLPYSAVKDVRKDFWDKGYTSQTDVSYRSGDANGNIFLSFQNLSSKGIVPGDKYTRNSLRFSSGKTSGKWTTSFDANYNWDKADRTTADFYFLSLNTAGWIPSRQLHSNWSTDKFADLGNYYNDYYNSPWWLKDNQRNITRNTNLNASARVGFKVNSNIDLNARLTMNNTNSISTSTSNNYPFTTFAQSRAYSDYFNNVYDRYLTGSGRFIARTQVLGAIGESTSNNTRFTGDLYAGYNKTFGDISVKAVVGAQASSSRGKATSVSTNGIGIPNFYNLSNSASGLYSGGNSLSETRKIGGFADLTLGYKNYAFLHGAFRNDRTSLFYDNNPAFGYDKPNFQTYGVDASVIVSELAPSIKGNILENLKIRASYNRNGNDNISPYALRLTYPNATGFPYSGLLGTSVSGLYPDPSLKPEIVTTTEAGIEVAFWHNRILVEGSVYRQNADQQVLQIDISGATGYQAYLLNAARLINKGYEVDLKFQALKNRNWNIMLQGNYSHNTNKVTEVYADLKNLTYQSSTLLTLNAEKDQMFPYLKTTAFQRDAAGHVVVDTLDGWPLRNSEFVGQGTTQPIHVLGLGFTASWKNLTLIANAEYRGGNVVYHNIGENMNFTGSGAQSAIYEREQFIWPNSVHYDAAGKLVTNTNYAVDQYKAIYQGFGDQGFSRGFSGVGEVYVSSGAFWKIRDLNLTYDLPRNLISKMKVVKGISITAFARNLKTWLPKDNWYTDPEFSNTGGNSQGINTTGNTPPVRQFGGSVKIIF
jgi:TonB-linked SusC/RagA family outer membrane protein